MTVAEQAMVVPGGDQEEDALARKIARVLDECRLSQAIHNRKLKELQALRTSSSVSFSASFNRALIPLFEASRRTVSSERVIRFASSFAAAAWEDEFFGEFLRFLLVASAAANKTVRFRSCQIVSEIIIRLPDDADVSDDIWDDVIDCMKQRVGDKVPAVRVFAVRALSRFANDAENSDITDLFLETLPQESNAEVRKTIVISMPPTSSTSMTIINCTLDISESVRKAAYCVIAGKFPLQSLSIKLRTIILQRGLMDRSSSVTKECLKMLKEEWLAKSCGGDPIVLLQLLDVETYESVGEEVMKALLDSGIAQVHGTNDIKQTLMANKIEGQTALNAYLMEPEVAFYWRTLCRHLQNEARAKGCDAAATTGAEAAVYASQASANNDLLEDVLPATVSDYVDLVKAHLKAGPNYRFVSRQLLLLGSLLDFSDLTNRKAASEFVQELLFRPLEHETDDSGSDIVIGDGINLGGDRDWARAVSELVKKVHASAGEFEETIASVIENLAQPCRERIANFLQWMHCLAVTGLLLENISSFKFLEGKGIEPNELLHSLLLPGVKHIHPEVQRVAIRCLCLFGLLERKPSEDLVKHLRLSFISGPSPVSAMACKALLDLATWHGIHELDRALSLNQSPSAEQKSSFVAVELCENEDVPVGLLDLLYSGFDKNEWAHDSESDEQDSVHAILGEGFAKILLLGDNYPGISTSLHPLILNRLIKLYFFTEAKELERLKQCLSVFFEHYPALSVAHKRCVSKAFIPVMRSMWPGIYGNTAGASVQISRMRKRAIQAAHFMLQMMQTPLLLIDTPEVQEENPSSFCTTKTSLDVDSGEEGLAIRIATEVVRYPRKKTAAEKSYVSSLCRIAVLLSFRSSEQDAIKCMRVLLNHMIECVSGDKDTVKDLMRMTSRLKALDELPDDESLEQVKTVLGRLELDVELEQITLCTKLPPTTPVAPRSVRTAPTKRRTRREASPDEEATPHPSLPMTPAMICTRSQRASKTAAMSKMAASSAIRHEKAEDDEGISDVTSEEVSDESSDEFIE